MKQYAMTLHAEEEKEDDALSIFDVEHAILTGKLWKGCKISILVSGSILSLGRLLTTR